MKCLILAAGRFDSGLKDEIARGREPRLDVFELASELGADVIDYGDVERSLLAGLGVAAKTAGRSAGVAMLGFQARHRYDAVFTTGEDIGLPFSALMAASSAPVSHTMIAHTLHPAKKRVFFRFKAATKRIDRVLVYSTSEERLATGELGLPREKV